MGAGVREEQQVTYIRVGDKSSILISLYRHLEYNVLIT
jgi:hypothetical protein